MPSDDSQLEEQPKVAAIHRSSGARFGPAALLLLTVHFELLALRSILREEPLLGFLPFDFN